MNIILKFFFSFLFLIYANNFFCVNSVPKRGINDVVIYTDSLNILLDRLDLTINADLNKLKIIKERSLLETELLKYFRSRKQVEHFIDRDLKPASYGKIAMKSDFEVADDALRHIFVGQSAYPRFFCGDDIDWGARPVPDNEWVWQLNRMGFWNSMARVYWHTLDEKYAEAWGYQLMDWVRKNPNDDNHKYAWRSIEAGIRGNNWIELYQRFIDSPSFTLQILVTFLNSLYDHASFLMTKYTTNSNWGLMEAEGLAAIGIFYPEFKDSKMWREEAFRRLNIEINKQVYPDGHQRELAMGYHMGCINWFLRTYRLAKMNGYEDFFPKSYVDKIEKMCEIPMKLCHPDGTNVQFGDDWTGSPGQYKNRFAEWAKFFNRKDFLYLATDGVEGVKPRETAYALPQSGLYSMRSDWNKDAISLTLKCGPDGGWHSQPDNGTFDLYAGDRILMPDAGSYIYSGDPEWRSWFRQTKVHQTITLNNENSTYDPKLLYWNTNDDSNILVVENQSYDDLTHRRSVIFVEKRYFVIVDEAYGTASGNVGLHFQLASGKSVSDQKNNTIRTDFPDGWNVFLKTRNTVGKIELIEEEGWISHKYTVKESRPAFCFNTVKKSSTPVIRFVTVLIPYNQKRSDIEVKIKNEPKNKVISQMRIEIIENNTKKNIEYNL